MKLCSLYIKASYLVDSRLIVDEPRESYDSPGHGQRHASKVVARSADIAGECLIHLSIGLLGGMRVLVFEAGCSPAEVNVQRGLSRTVRWEVSRLPTRRGLSITSYGCL